MGRWSRQMAERFLDGCIRRPRRTGSSVGCGTGALTRRSWPRNARPRSRSRPSILRRTSSPAARAAVPDPQGALRARGEARSAAGWRAATIDVVGLGAGAQFRSGPAGGAASSAQRVLTAGRRCSASTSGTIRGAGSSSLDCLLEGGGGGRSAGAESRRGHGASPFCDPRHDRCGASSAARASRRRRSSAIDDPNGLSPMFEDLWDPFTLGAGPAPGYCRSLHPEIRARLRERLEARLGGRGPIAMQARAWAVWGRSPA